MVKTLTIAVAASLTSAVLGGCVRRAPVTAPMGARGHANASAADSGRAGGPPGAPRPYATVITHDAKTSVGMFTTHRIGDRLLFEIPAREFGRDMLLVGRYARAAAAEPQSAQTPYGGDEFTERTIRWERNGNKVILRETSFDITADSSLPISRAVAASNYSEIIALFDVAAYGADSAAVIDVTRLYTNSVTEFSAIRGQVDPTRSYLESAVAFPENVEVEATQTGNTVTLPGASNGHSGGTQSVVAHWSMVRLPDIPMQPRWSDERVGYFSVSQFDFGTTEQRAARRKFITRWRLEKKDPAAPVSETLKPLVYYIDPATPDVWKPWIRKAILDWQPAFEAAGFKHAIIAADPPVTDSSWSAEDVRHTVIRWLPSTIENATGPHIADPRTGEILNGSIRIFHNVLNLQRLWYVTQAGPLDPRAQQLPLPDSLMGRLLEYVVAHEIGHTLGLRHDMLGSTTYPADSVRSRTWVHRMGHTPSIMDYSRFNYVAQPEDHLDVNDLVPRIGPYDFFAIAWGYRPIPDQTSETERPQLDQWARAQDTVPWYRFAEDNEGGYGTIPEAVGDADPVKSTGYGIKNLRRVLSYLPKATTRAGEDNSDLEEFYDTAVNQWTREMVHVATVVGGSSVQYKSGSQPGAVYTPLPRAKQQAAVKFLNDNAFATPTYLVDAAMLRRFEPAGTVARIGNAQRRILGTLFDGDLLNRLVDYEAVPTGAVPHDTYTLHTMLDDVQHGVWTELGSPRVSVDVFRRNLQNVYLGLFDTMLNPPQSGQPRQWNALPEVRTALRGELIVLETQVKGAIPRAQDEETRVHLLGVRDQIERVLDPNR